MLFNTPRAVEYMHRCGLDALVATSPVNITYFTDYACWFDPLFREYMMVPGAPSNRAQSYAVFPREGEAAFVVSAPLFAVNAADLWVRDLSIYGSPGVDTSLPPTALSDAYRRFFDLFTASSHHPTALDALVSALRTRGLTGARIGLEMEGLALASHEAIARALPRADIKDCSNLIRLLRMVKTPDELARLTRAAEISEQAAMESLALARPGRPMAELSQYYRARVAEQGAAFDHFAFGVNGLGIATEPEYVPEQGDVEYVDFGCVYRQCFSDSGTTLATGEASPVLSDRFAALRTCLDAAISIMRPGVKASAVQAPMQATLKAYGLTGSFPHGHGVGLEVRDYPIIVPDNGLRIRDDCIDVPSDLTLEADMVINLEAPLFMPGVGSLHIEQSFVITPNGCRPLVSQDRGRIVTSDE